jgi:hypothetical protein
MYNDFREYSAAFHAKQSDILHYGVKGMRWGVITWMDKLKKRLGYGVGDKRDSRKDNVMTSKQHVVNVGNSIIRNKSYENAEKSLKEWEEGQTKWWELWKQNPESSAAQRWLDKSDKAMENAVKEYSTYEKYSTNCPNCTLALELKKRGMEVRPKGTGGRTANEIHDIYVNEKTTSCRNNKDFWKAANYGKPGDHGAIMGLYGGNRGGHIFNYTVLKGGKVQLEDAQSGKVMTLEEAYRTGAMALSNFQYGEILNLTKAEIDMDEVRKHDMVDTSSYRNGNNLKMQQYERNTKKYVQNKKKAEKFLKNILKRLLGRR